MKHMTDDQWLALQAYVLAVCAPLLDAEDRPGLEARVDRDAATALVYVFAPRPSFLVGGGGKTADAIRQLCKIRARVLGYRGGIDLRVETTIPPAAI